MSKKKEPPKKTVAEIKQETMQVLDKTAKFFSDFFEEYESLMKEKGGLKLDEHFDYLNLFNLITALSMEMGRHSIKISATLGPTIITSLMATLVEKDKEENKEGIADV